MKLVRYSSATGTFFLSNSKFDSCKRSFEAGCKKKLINTKKVILSLGAWLLGIIGAAISSICAAVCSGTTEKLIS